MDKDSIPLHSRRDKRQDAVHFQLPSVSESQLPSVSESQPPSPGRPGLRRQRAYSSVVRPLSHRHKEGRLLELINEGEPEAVKRFLLSEENKQDKTLRAKALNLIVKNGKIGLLMPLWQDDVLTKDINYEGYNALHLAVKYGQLRMVKYFIRKDIFRIPKIDITNKIISPKKYNAIHLAFLHQNFDVVMLFFKTLNDDFNKAFTSGSSYSAFINELKTLKDTEIDAPKKYFYNKLLSIIYKDKDKNKDKDESIINKFLSTFDNSKDDDKNKLIINELSIYFAFDRYDLILSLRKNIGKEAFINLAEQMNCLDGFILNCCNFDDIDKINDECLYIALRDHSVMSIDNIITDKEMLSRQDAKGYTPLAKLLKHPRVKKDIGNVIIIQYLLEREKSFSDENPSWARPYHKGLFQHVCDNYDNELLKLLLIYDIDFIEVEGDIDNKTFADHILEVIKSYPEIKNSLSEYFERFSERHNDELPGWANDTILKKLGYEVWDAEAIKTAHKNENEMSEDFFDPSLLQKVYGYDVEDIEETEYLDKEIATLQHDIDEIIASDPTKLKSFDAYDDICWEQKIVADEDNTALDSSGTSTYSEVSLANDSDMSIHASSDSEEFDISDVMFETFTKPDIPYTIITRTYVQVEEFRIEYALGNESILNKLFSNIDFGDKDRTLFINEKLDILEELNICLNPDLLTDSAPTNDLLCLLDILEIGNEAIFLSWLLSFPTCSLNIMGVDGSSLFVRIIEHISEVKMLTAIDNYANAYPFLWQETLQKHGYTNIVNQSHALSEEEKSTNQIILSHLANQELCMLGNTEQQISAWCQLLEAQQNYLSPDLLVQPVDSKLIDLLYALSPDSVEIIVNYLLEKNYIDRATTELHDKSFVDYLNHNAFHINIFNTIKVYSKTNEAIWPTMIGYDLQDAMYAIQPEKLTQKQSLSNRVSLLNFFIEYVKSHEQTIDELIPVIHDLSTRLDNENIYLNPAILQNGLTYEQVFELFALLKPRLTNKDQLSEILVNLINNFSNQVINFELAKGPEAICLSDNLREFCHYPSVYKSLKKYIKHDIERWNRTVDFSKNEYLQNEVFSVTVAALTGSQRLSNLYILEQLYQEAITNRQDESFISLLDTTEKRAHIEAFMIKHQICLNPKLAVTETLLANIDALYSHLKNIEQQGKEANRNELAVREFYQVYSANQASIPTNPDDYSLYHATLIQVIYQALTNTLPKESFLWQRFLSAVLDKLKSRLGLSFDNEAEPQTIIRTVLYHFTQFKQHGTDAKDMPMIDESSDISTLIKHCNWVMLQDICAPYMHSLMYRFLVAAESSPMSSDVKAESCQAFLAYLSQHPDFSDNENIRGLCVNNTSVLFSVNHPKAWDNIAITLKQYIETSPEHIGRYAFELFDKWWTEEAGQLFYLQHQLQSAFVGSTEREAFRTVIDCEFQILESDIAELNNMTGKPCLTFQKTKEHYEARLPADRLATEIKQACVTQQANIQEYKYDLAVDLKIANLMKYPGHVNKASSELEAAPKGDLHSNALNLLHFLIYEGVVDFPSEACDCANLVDCEHKPERLYEKFANLYYKKSPLENQTTAEMLEDLTLLLSIINKLRPGKDAKKKLLIFIGDIFCDRGKNDALQLALLIKLKELITPNNFTISFSNHDIAFLEFYFRNFPGDSAFFNGERAVKEWHGFKHGLALEEMDAANFSSLELKSLRTRAPETRSLDALRLLGKAYYEKNIASKVRALFTNYRLINYTWDGQVLHLLPHSQISLDAIEAVARKFAIPYQHSLTDPRPLMRTIDNINAYVIANMRHIVQQFIQEIELGACINQKYDPEIFIPHVRYDLDDFVLSAFVWSQIDRADVCEKLQQSPLNPEGQTYRIVCDAGHAGNIASLIKDRTILNSDFGKTQATRTDVHSENICGFPNTTEPSTRRHVVESAAPMPQFDLNIPLGHSLERLIDTPIEGLTNPGDENIGVASLPPVKVERPSATKRKYSDGESGFFTSKRAQAREEKRRQTEAEAQRQKEHIDKLNGYFDKLAKERELARHHQETDPLAELKGALIDETTVADSTSATSNTWTFEQKPVGTKADEDDSDSEASLDADMDIDDEVLEADTIADKTSMLRMAARNASLGDPGSVKLTFHVDAKRQLIDVNASGGKNMSARVQALAQAAARMGQARLDNVTRNKSPLLNVVCIDDAEMTRVGNALTEYVLELLTNKVLPLLSSQGWERVIEEITKTHKGQTSNIATKLQAMTAYSRQLVNSLHPQHHLLRFIQAETAKGYNIPDTKPLMQLSARTGLAMS